MLKMECALKIIIVNDSQEKSAKKLRNLRTRAVCSSQDREKKNISETGNLEKVTFTLFCAQGRGEDR